MSRRLSWALLTLSAAVLVGGCDVEDPSFGFDGGIPDDAGVPDAGPEDAGVEDCRFAPEVCTEAQFCGDEGLCLDRDRACFSTSECSALDVCARPLVATSTVVAPGRCAPTPGACAVDADCSRGVCLAVGLCGPAAARAEADGRALVPRAACTVAADCGLGGVCRGGICASCRVNADCAGGLRCDDGACTEPLSCGGAEDCFTGNRCEGGRCLRATEACTPDSEDDTLERARPIEAGYYAGLTICGADEDWYALDVPQARGVEVVITSTASQASLLADITDGLGDTVDGLTRLDLPGFTVLRLAGGDAREVLLRVYSADATGAYELSVRYSGGQCASDAVEMYGDDLETPSNVVFEGTMCPDTEERRVFAAAAGDVVFAELELEPLAEGALSSTQTLELRSPEGAALFTGTGLDRTITATATANAGGTYAVAARASRLASAGTPYTMRLVRKLAGRDSACLSPPALDPTSGPITVRGDLFAATDLGRPDCSVLDDEDAGYEAPLFAEATRNDLLYALAAPVEDTLLRVSVSVVSGTDPQLSVALLPECAKDTQVAACDSAPFPRSTPTLQAVLSPDEAPPTLVVSSDGPAEDVVFDLTVEYVSLASFPDDRCAGATPLVGTGTQAVVLFGGTRNGVPYGAQNDDQLWQDRVSDACLGVAQLAPDVGAGGERYFSLSLDPGELAAVELSGPPNGMLWTGLACEDMPGTCQQAQIRDFSQPVLRATFTASTAGTEHVIVVDGLEADTEGTYTLRVVRDAQCLDDGDCQGANLNLCGASPCRCDDYACATPPGNDRCSGTALGVGADGRTRISGSTGAASDDYATSCYATDSGQPDVVYSIEVPEGTSELVARVTEATFDPMLEVRQAVCVDSENSRRWCVDDVRFPDVLLPEVRVSEPEADIYFIVVDSYAGEGAFTLEVELR